MLGEVAVEVGRVESRGDVGEVEFVEGRLGEEIEQLVFLGVENEFDFVGWVGWIIL